VDGLSEVELVYVFARRCWGRGYATEAAEAIRDYALCVAGLTRLVSLIDPAHTASERVALKLGMKRETDTVRPNGKTMRVYAVCAEQTDFTERRDRVSVDNLKPLPRRR